MRLTQKRLLWGSVAACLLLAGGLFLFLYRDHVTMATFLQIHPGMSESEVISLFGRPPDEQASALESGMHIPVNSDPYPEWVKAWIEREGDSFIIFFDEHGEVCNKCILPSEGYHPTVLERLRRWVGW
jgi:hypothetical protein